MTKLALILFIASAVLMQTGCTVLGVIADSQISSDNRHQQVDQHTGMVKAVEQPSVLTELGMAIDGAVIDTVKKLSTQEKAKPKEVCKHNGYFMECRPAGKQRESLID